MNKASTDANQSMNLEEEVSTEANLIEESKLKIIIDLNEKDKEKKKADELPEIYSPKVSFPSALEAGSSTLESSHSSELKSPCITSEYLCLESSDILSASITSNSTPNSKIQFFSILEEQIGEIFNKQGSVNGFINYLFKIKNRDVKYFLKIGNKLLKFIIGHLHKIDNLKSLKFINPIFDTG